MCAVSYTHLDVYKRQVLDSRDGRRYFREFLTSRGLEESEAALEFWERCEVLLRSNSESSSSHPKSAGENSTSSGHSKSLQ